MSNKLSGIYKNSKYYRKVINKLDKQGKILINKT